MLKHIETKEDYAEYERRVASFREKEGIKLHSPIDNGDGEGDPSAFSWTSCECCGRDLGGDRYAIKAGSVRGGFFVYSVCVDCYYYLEYGQLDDRTMMDLK